MVLTAYKPHKEPSEWKIKILTVSSLTWCNYEYLYSLRCYALWTIVLLVGMTEEGEE